MHNKETIEFINTNYNKLIKTYSNKFRNTQIAEDCLSRVCIKLLERDYGVINNNAFISSAMLMQFLNYKRVNKRLFLESAEYLDTESEFKKEREDLIFHPDIESEIDKKRFDKTLKRFISTLTPKRQLAVNNYLISGQWSVGESERTHLKLAIKNLRIYFEDNNIE